MSDTSTMEGDLPVEYYTEAGRLESFQIAHPLPKRIDSSTKGRGAKPAKWPHSWLEPKSLAEAGFIYMPEPGNLDNVMCFLCRRSICGWTSGDEPLAEHLKLSPDCGWAITSCIEAKVGDIHLENPMSTRMVEARKATFGDRWPHEGKKGWKCKTKSLVEAGWIYKPTYDGDDFAECIYCTLALDGWEPADKPFHEHHARSSDCAFFELCNRPESPITKKATTKRKPRTSKVASTRLSMQSTLEPEPSYLEAPSFANESVQDEGDSIATTTSTIMPKGKGKKATAAKGRKKKVEVVEDSDHEMNAPSDQEEAPPPPPKAAKGRKGKKVKEEAPPPAEHNQSVVSQTLVVEESQPKARRGKKRLSDSEHDESIIAPAPKRRTRNSVAMQDSMSLMPTESSMNHTNEEITASTPPKKAPAPKKKPARASRSRKVSGASVAPSTGDERLDQQLEDELDRQLEDMDVQNPSRTVSPEMLNPKPAMPPLGRKLRNSGARVIETTHHDMFNEMEVDDEVVERELEKMAEEEQISKPLPKAGKGKKAATERKVSVKQQVKEEKARRKAAEEEAKREKAAREAEELRLRQEAEAEELRLQQEADEAEELRRQREVEEAEELRLQEEEDERRRVAAQAKAEEEERAYQAERKAEQDRLDAQRRQAEEEAEAHRLELEAEAEERRLELEAEAEEEEERRLLEEEENRRRVERDAEDERVRLEAEASAIQEKLRKKNEVAAAKAAAAATKAKTVKGKGKAKPKPKSPSPVPEPSPSPLPARSSSERSPTPAAHSTPAPQSAASARSANRSAISTRSQRSVRTLSPSASPQSSDAENRPPSSRPSSSVQPSSAMTARQVLGATTPKTPSRTLNRGGGGGEKKNGLSSEEPWKEVDLDTIFAHMRSPGKENQDLGLGVGKGELSEEERQMTVEQWIRYNAWKAEERLKGECEALVGVFEREGGRAMRRLEGVETVDG